MDFLSHFGFHFMMCSLTSPRRLMWTRGRWESSFFMWPQLFLASDVDLRSHSVHFLAGRWDGGAGHTCDGRGPRGGLAEFPLGGVAVLTASRDPPGSWEHPRSRFPTDGVSVFLPCSGQCVDDGNDSLRNSHLRSHRSCTVNRTPVCSVTLDPHWDFREDLLAMGTLTGFNYGLLGCLCRHICTWMC